MSEDNGSKCCEYVEEMANKLENFKGFSAVVFEGNNEAMVEGFIEDVIDGEILHMKFVEKVIFTSSGAIANEFEEIFIIICKITGFAPIFGKSGAAATSAQGATMKKKLLPNSNTTRLR